MSGRRGGEGVVEAAKWAEIGGMAGLGREGREGVEEALSPVC